jgi:hypothetical protein
VFSNPAASCHGFLEIVPLLFLLIESSLSANLAGKFRLSR